MKIFVVIPAHNEEKKIGKVLKDLKKNGYMHVIVVDDGSSDRTMDIAENYATVIRHPINQGAGAATVTGFDYAVRHGADIIVTIDADGQHDVSDIKKVIRPILDKKAELVIGSRLLNSAGMPFVRKFGNSCLNIITLLL